jgi:hypothetical protein
MTTLPTNTVSRWTELGSIMKDGLIAPRLNRKYTNPRYGNDVYDYDYDLVRNENEDSPKLLLCTAIRFSEITYKSYNPGENISLRNIDIPTTGSGSLWRFEMSRIPH